MKVKKKHLKGQIANFPKHVVQAMCDEQVRQGNPFNPEVFSDNLSRTRAEGGFNWRYSKKGLDFWDDVLAHQKFDLIPKPKKHHPKKKLKKHTPHEVIKAMLDNGLVVWAGVSNMSESDARISAEDILYRLNYASMDADVEYKYSLNIGMDFIYAVPIDTATMQEIKELPE